MPTVIVLALLLAAAVIVLILRQRVGRVTVYEFQRGLRYQNGRLAGLVEPGVHWIWRPSTTIQLVDVRQSVLAVPGQEVVTSDGVSVRLSLAVRQKLADPIVALTEIDDYRGATYSAVQVALRETVSALPIDELLQRREAVGPEVLRRSLEPARAFGVEISAVHVRDLMFPGPMKRLFAQVVEARQQGLATLEKARGETAALRSLANAARMVEASPSLLQLRLLQQLESTSGNTVVLGMPSNSTPLPLRSEPAEGPRALEPGSTPAADAEGA